MHSRGSRDAPCSAAVPTPIGTVTVLLPARPAVRDGARRIRRRRHPTRSLRVHDLCIFPRSLSFRRLHNRILFHSLIHLYTYTLLPVLLPADGRASAPPGTTARRPTTTPLHSTSPTAAFAARTRSHAANGRPACGARTRRATTEAPPAARHARPTHNTTESPAAPGNPGAASSWTGRIRGRTADSGAVARCAHRWSLLASGQVPSCSWEPDAATASDRSCASATRTSGASLGVTRVA